MPINPVIIRQIAERYTKAWCARSAEAVASFYAENATSIINAGEPATGRPATAAAMGVFFQDLPDLLVHMDDLRSG